MTALMRARDPDVVRALMQERGKLSYRQLGRLARVSYATINNILDGKNTTRETAKRIASSLGRGVDDLFADATSSDKRDNVKQNADEDAA